MMDTATQSGNMAGRIDEMMGIDPVQTRAFLLGMQSGYYLAKNQQPEAETPKQ